MARATRPAGGNVQTYRPSAPPPYGVRKGAGRGDLPLPGAAPTAASSTHAAGTRGGNTQAVMLGR